MMLMGIGDISSGGWLWWWIARECVWISNFGGWIYVWKYFFSSHFQLKSCRPNFERDFVLKVFQWISMWTKFSRTLLCQNTICKIICRPSEKCEFQNNANKQISTSFSYLLFFLWKVFFLFMQKILCVFTANFILLKLRRIYFV